jgi:predicted kinase
MNIISLLENKINIDKENDVKLQAMLKSSSPQIILLVGLPGSGKSTFVNNYRLKKHGIIASTDNIIEQKAKDQGSTYSEIFHKIDFKEVERQMKDEIRKAVSEKQNIIVDQTNMSDKSRSSKMDLVPKSYDRYAIVFWPDIKTVQKRLEKREKETGKVIPKKVIDSMLANFVPPSEKEGFKSIIFVK